MSETEQSTATAARLKAPDCRHQYDGEPHCVPAVLNHYHCDDCGVSWSDEWSCACDDECPECGKAYTPEESEELSDCACEYLS